MKIMFIEECFPSLKEGGIATVEAGVTASVIDKQSGKLMMRDGTIIIGVKSRFYAEVDYKKMKKLRVYLG